MKIFEFFNNLREPWLINSSGKKDWMLTFSAIGLAVSCLSLITSLVGSITIRETTINFEKPDTTLVLGILSATLGSYVMRRHKKDTIDHIENLEKMKQDKEV